MFVNSRGEVRSTGWLCLAPDERCGLALIEVMFATGIMALTLTMIFGSVISLSDLSSISENRRVASSHLANTLEQMRGSSYDAVVAFTPQASDASETVTAVCVDAKGIERPLPLDVQSLPEPLPNPFDVRVTVSRLGAKGHSHVVRGAILVTR